MSTFVTLMYVDVRQRTAVRQRTSRDFGHAPNPIFTQSIKYLLHVHSELAA